MTIFPIPQKLTLTEGTCPVGIRPARTVDSSLNTEEYKINITPDRIEMIASCDEGFFRADSTMKQILAQNPNTLPCLQLHDWPDYPKRGLYVSIWRIYKPCELKKLIDMIADMKLNVIQLPLGTQDFNFPSFPEMHISEAPYSTKELNDLTAYAEERFVELIPVTSAFDASDFFKNENYIHLAECPDGYEMWGGHHDPGCLNPLDPASLEFVQRRISDVIEAFPACHHFNICCDETWELGMGKSKEECEHRGRTRVYLDFVSKVIAYLRERNIKPMFWADIVLQGKQEVIDTIPKDAVALNWGYERYQVTEDSCIRLQKSGVPYWNCPGTAVWRSLLGESYKSMQSIARSTVLGKRHGASGILNTDWTDFPFNHISPSYLPIAYCAGMSWKTAEEDFHPLLPLECEDDLHAIVEPDAAQIAKISPTMAACFDYLNAFVFKDTRGKMAQLAYDAGQYAHISTKPGVANTTIPNHVLVQPVDSKNTFGYDAKDFEDIKDYINVILFRLSREQNMTCDEAQTILDEYRDSAAIMLYACDLALYRLDQLGGKTPEEYAAMMRSRRDEILPEHLRICQIRTRNATNQSIPYFRQFD